MLLFYLAAQTTRMERHHLRYTHTHTHNYSQMNKGDTEYARCVLCKDLRVKSENESMTSLSDESTTCDDEEATFHLLALNSI